MRIIDLTPNDGELIRQAAQVLFDAFKINWPNAWPTLEEAIAEVHESFAPDRLSRVAIDEDSTLLGWIGGIEHYSGHVWELHPLAVKTTAQRRGIGRALVADLEQQVSRRGALTLWLGTDDERGMTSLAGVDLYPNVWAHLARIKNLRGHPYGFYQKLGFAIVGVVPDANGLGKPDILMAKRVKGSER